MRLPPIPRLQRWPRRAGARAPWIRADCTGGLPLPGAVLPHGAGRPARRFAEAFPARSGHFPERWRPFSGALGACSGRQPQCSGLSDRIGHATPTFCPRISTMSENIHSVRELTLLGQIVTEPIPDGKPLSRLSQLCLIRRPGAEIRQPSAGADLKLNVGVVSTSREGSIRICEVAP